MSSEQHERLEEQLAGVEEATEQTMHSAAELLPNSEEVHERADRLSENAEKHRRSVERRRAEYSEPDGSTAEDEDLP